MYLGPLEYDRIKEVGQGLEGIMDFGWSPVRPISKAVLLTLTKCTNTYQTTVIYWLFFSNDQNSGIPFNKKSLPVNYSNAKNPTRTISNKRKI